MTEQELREMIRKFLDLNPTDEQIEAFYINEVLPHDKRSINEIMDTRKQYEKAHPDFIMPEGVQIPSYFIDVSFKDDEYPSWMLDRKWNGRPKCVFYIAYDHGYDNGTWEDLVEMGIYWLSTTHDYLGIHEVDQKKVTNAPYKTFEELLNAIEEWKENESFTCSDCGLDMDQHDLRSYGQCPFPYTDQYCEYLRGKYVEWEVWPDGTDIQGIVYWDEEEKDYYIGAIGVWRDYFAKEKIAPFIRLKEIGINKILDFADIEKSFTRNPINGGE